MVMWLTPIQINPLVHTDNNYYINSGQNAKDNYLRILKNNQSMYTLEGI